MNARPWPLLAQGLSAALHLGLFAAAWLARPPLGATDMSSAEPVPALHLGHLVFADVAELEEEPEVLASTGSTWAADEGRGIAQATGSDRRAGSNESEAAAGRVAIQGPQDYPYPAPLQRGWEHRWTTWPFGPPKDAAGDPRGLDAERDGIGADPQNTQGNNRAPAAAPAIGLSGVTPTGAGQGGGVQACVGPRGNGAIGARSAPFGRGTSAPNADRAGGKHAQGSSAAPRRAVAPIANGCF